MLIVVDRPVWRRVFGRKIDVQNLTPYKLIVYVSQHPIPAVMHRVFLDSSKITLEGLVKIQVMGDKDDTKNRISFSVPPGFEHVYVSARIHTRSSIVMMCTNELVPCGKRLELHRLEY